VLHARLLKAVSTAVLQLDCLRMRLQSPDGYKRRPVPKHPPMLMESGGEPESSHLVMSERGCRSCARRHGHGDPPAKATFRAA